MRSTQELLDLLREFIAEGLAMMIISHEADDLVQAHGRSPGSIRHRSRVSPVR